MNIIILYIFAILYFIDVASISIIDRRNRNIDKRLLVFGIMVSLGYMIYVYLVDPTSIYRYLIYLGGYVVLLFIDTFLLRRYAEDSYLVNILMFFNMMVVFWEYKVAFITLIIFGLIIGMYILKRKINKPRNAKIAIKYNEIQYGYYLGISNMISILIIMIVNCLNR